MHALEVGGGLRVGEAVGGGDNHGVLADNVCIFTNVATGEEFVEARIEHSKTKFERFVTILGTTKGEVALPTACFVRDYWRESGVPMRPTIVEGGYRVERPDYQVVRVSLLGMSQQRVEELCVACELSGVAAVRAQAASTRKYAFERFAAVTSMDKKYVNVFGGAADDPGMGMIARDLAMAGFASDTPQAPVSRVAGPLVRATAKAGKMCTYMPVGTQTASEMSKLLLLAFALAKSSLDGPDPQMDLEGREAPVFGEHSNRRLANTVARRTMEQTGASEMDIDLTLGWQERMYTSRMSIHYEQRFTRERRAAVTSLL